MILAAGAIQTPALLQLSGIGDSALLSKIGVNTLIDLKTVGRNLQEQVCLRAVIALRNISSDLSDNELPWCARKWFR